MLGPQISNDDVLESQNRKVLPVNADTYIFNPFTAGLWRHKLPEQLKKVINDVASAIRGLPGGSPFGDIRGERVKKNFSCTIYTHS